MPGAMRGCRLRPFGHIALALCAAGSLAACTEVVDSVVDSRYGEYNRQTDWAKNEAILLNIVRASEYQPLNFMSFQPYTGTASVSGAASSPSFIIGPARVASQKQYTLGQGTLTASASGTGTVGVTMLDTQNFYQAVLSPVDFTNLYQFQQQGYPRELLFRLFAENVSLEPLQSNDPQGRGAFMLSNDPAIEKSCLPLPEALRRLYAQKPPPLPPPNKVCFDDLVLFALLSGLSSEIRTAPNPAAANAKKAGTGTGAGTNTGSDQTGSGASSSTTPATITEGRLCFDGALANRARIEYRNQYQDAPAIQRFLAAITLAQYHPICGGTGPDDKWAPTGQQQSTTPSAANQAAAKQAQQKLTTAKADLANEPNADKKQTIQKQVTTLQETYNAAQAKLKPASGTKPSSDSTSGKSILTVVVNVPTGNPVWDIHLISHYSVIIGTRSTFSIYNFLGRLVKQQNSVANHMIGPPSEEEYDPQILTINMGQVTGCFTATEFNLGLYCVPIQGAQNTKTSFSILSQLLALKTTTGDLQLTPTLRLVP
jgi:hypothetical protein